MIRSELIQKIADENPHLYQRDVEKIVNTIFNEITDALAQGNRVELRGFGAFSVKKRDGRIGRNPRTGESVAAARLGSRRCAAERVPPRGSIPPELAAESRVDIAPSVPGMQNKEFVKI